jgi:pimeloyl-ACP methyl ester carboxylesterase
MIKRILFGLSALGLAVFIFVLGWSAYTNGQIDAMETRSHRAEAPGRFATVQGYDLHYQVMGDLQNGVPLLLIHGFASNGGEFRRLTPALAEGRAIIIPDLPGFGHSQRVPAPTEAYTHRGQAALLRELLDGLAVAQVDVGGASYGGGVALQFALDYPDRVRRLVLLDAQAYEGGGGAWVASLPFGLDRALTWYVLGGGPGAAMLTVSACAPDGATCSRGEFEAARDRIVRIAGHTEALLAFSRTARVARIPQEIGNVAQPALVVWGRQDGIIAPEFGERLARELPQARLEWVEGAGHVPHIERPEVVLPLIEAFLR